MILCQTCNRHNCKRYSPPHVVVEQAIGFSIAARALDQQKNASANAEVKLKAINTSPAFPRSLDLSSGLLAVTGGCALIASSALHKQLDMSSRDA